MPAALVATSSGSGCVWPESPGQQVLVEEVVVSVELSTHDDAVRGVVALISPWCAQEVCLVFVLLIGAQQRTAHSFDRVPSVWSRLVRVAPRWWCRWRRTGGVIACER